MIVSAEGVTTDDGTFLPLDFLEGPEVFNQAILAAAYGRTHFDDVLGLWIEGFYKDGALLAYKSKVDIDMFYQTFASSSTFTVPAGVTTLRVIVVGAGGAAGNNYSRKLSDGTTISNTGGSGGQGGLVYGILSVTPGESITATVGAAVTNSGGGTSSFSTLTATGGGRGGNAGSSNDGSSGSTGVGSGAGSVFTATSPSWNATFVNYFARRIPSYYDSYNMYVKRTQNLINPTSTAIQWSFTEDYRPGAGAPADSENDGIGGNITVFWS